MITCTKQDSGNQKLGDGVRATYREVGPTCPNECELLETEVCYAMKGPTAIHSGDSPPSNEDADRILEYLMNLPGGKKIRHHVSGDFFLDNEPDWSYITAILHGHRKRSDLNGWTYTHGWKRLYPDLMNSTESLTCNASCDTIEEAHTAYDNGWPTVVVVPPDSEGGYTEDGTKVVVCPYQTDDITCSDCMLCTQQDRNFIIGFREH